MNESEQYHDHEVRVYSVITLHVSNVISIGLHQGDITKLLLCIQMYEIFSNFLILSFIF